MRLLNVFFLFFPLMFITSMRKKTVHDSRPVERGGRGESFPGPRDVWGARRRSKILKIVFQVASFWPKICIKSIFGRVSAPDSAGGAYDAPPNP